MGRIRGTPTPSLADTLISMLIFEPNSPRPPRGISSGSPVWRWGLGISSATLGTDSAGTPGLPCHSWVPPVDNLVVNERDLDVSSKVANDFEGANVQASLPRPLLLLPSPPQRLLDCFSGRNILEKVLKEPPFRQLPHVPASFNLIRPH